MRSLATAFTLLTAIPIPGVRRPSLSPDVPGYFPLVGVFVGGLALLMLEAARSASVLLGRGTLLDQGGYLLGALVVGYGALVTRSIHWDGLADTADAIWSPGDTERRLEIMADSATGAFGATAIVIVATTQVAAYGAILSSPSILGWVVLASPVFARAAATFAAWLGTPARMNGLGSPLMGRPGVLAVLTFVLTLTGIFAVISVAHEMYGLVWGVIAILSALAVPHLIAGRIGGVTGDVMGASILITETVLLSFAGVMSAL